MGLPELSIRGHRFKWEDRTHIMGVVNVTPDSFSDGGNFLSPADALRQAGLLVAAGADILDIGGESTRPFSEPVSIEEELRRVIPVIRGIRGFTDCPISVDTTKAEVARRALDAGADIVNDVSALTFDPGMADIVVARGAPVILMHMKGTPGDMQVSPRYADLVEEVRLFLKERIAAARSRGIPGDRILVDPGIGFGKSFEDNLVLINRLGEFSGLETPICVGASRKAFLGAITGVEKAGERDVATLGAVAVAAVRGAHLVRVHDVARARQVLQVVDAIRRETIRSGSEN